MNGNESSGEKIIGRKSGIKYCGGGCLEVLRYQYRGIVGRFPIECECEHQLEIAGAGHQVIVEESISTGRLQRDGTFELSLPVVKGTFDWEVLGNEAACDLCYDLNVDTTQEYATSWDLPERERWVVRSTGRCQTELPFAWTGTNRSGQIVVVGIHYFDPKTVYPEPRFVKDWEELCKAPKIYDLLIGGY